MQKYLIFESAYSIIKNSFKQLNMNKKVIKHIMKKISIFLSITLMLILFSSCEEKINETQTPNIIFDSPTIENFLIGENINISISINHNEVLDDVKYYEILNCSDDNFDSLNLLEWGDIYETEWSFEKIIETTNFPQDISCTCTIQVEATDLNDIMSQTEITLNISD